MKVFKAARQDVEKLIESFVPELELPNPGNIDVIDIRNRNLVALQNDQQELLTNVLNAVTEAIESTEDREEDFEAGLTVITEMIERLKTSLATLEKEKKVTESFEKNLAALILSLKPPKAEEE